MMYDALTNAILAQIATLPKMVRTDVRDDFGRVIAHVYTRKVEAYPRCRCILGGGGSMREREMTERVMTNQDQASPGSFFESPLEAPACKAERMPTPLELAARNLRRAHAKASAAENRLEVLRELGREASAAATVAYQEVEVAKSELESIAVVSE